MPKGQTILHYPLHNIQLWPDDGSRLVEKLQSNKLLGGRSFGWLLMFVGWLRSWEYSRWSPLGKHRQPRCSATEMFASSPPVLAFVISFSVLEHKGDFDLDIYTCSAEKITLKRKCLIQHDCGSPTLWLSCLVPGQHLLSCLGLSRSGQRLAKSFVLDKAAFYTHNHNWSLLLWQEIGIRGAGS